MNYLTAIDKGFFFVIFCSKRFMPISVTNDASEIKEAVKNGFVLTAHTNAQEAQSFFNKLNKKG